MRSKKKMFLHEMQWLALKYFSCVVFEVSGDTFELHMFMHKILCLLFEAVICKNLK